jgi:hypothetical protein
MKIIDYFFDIIELKVYLPFLRLNWLFFFESLTFCLNQRPSKLGKYFVWKETFFSAKGESKIIRKIFLNPTALFQCQKKVNFAEQ